MFGSIGTPGISKKERIRYFIDEMTYFLSNTPLLKDIQNIQTYPQLTTHLIRIGKDVRKEEERFRFLETDRFYYLVSRYIDMYNITVELFYEIEKDYPENEKRVTIQRRMTGETVDAKELLNRIKNILEKIESSPSRDIVDQFNILIDWVDELSDVVTILFTESLKIKDYYVRSMKETVNKYIKYTKNQRWYGYLTDKARRLGSTYFQKDLTTVNIETLKRDYRTLALELENIEKVEKELGEIRNEIENIHAFISKSALILNIKESEFPIIVNYIGLKNGERFYNMLEKEMTLKEPLNESMHKYIDTIIEDLIGINLYGRVDSEERIRWLKKELVKEKDLTQKYEEILKKATEALKNCSSIVGRRFKLEKISFGILSLIRNDFNIETYKQIMPEIEKEVNELCQNYQRNIEELKKFFDDYPELKVEKIELTMRSDPIAVTKCTHCGSCILVDIWEDVSLDLSKKSGRENILSYCTWIQKSLGLENQITQIEKELYTKMQESINLEEKRIKEWFGIEGILFQETQKDIFSGIYMERVGILRLIQNYEKRCAYLNTVRENALETKVKSVLAEITGFERVFPWLMNANLKRLKEEISNIKIPYHEKFNERVEQISSIYQQIIKEKKRILLEYSNALQNMANAICTYGGFKCNTQLTVTTEAQLSIDIKKLVMCLNGGISALSNIVKNTDLNFTEVTLKIDHTLLPELRKTYDMVINLCFQLRERMYFLMNKKTLLEKNEISYPFPPIKIEELYGEFLKEYVEIYQEITTRLNEKLTEYEKLGVLTEKWKINERASLINVIQMFEEKVNTIMNTLKERYKSELQNILINEVTNKDWMKKLMTMNLNIYDEKKPISPLEWADYHINHHQDDKIKIIAAAQIKYLIDGYPKRIDEIKNEIDKRETIKELLKYNDEIQKEREYIKKYKTTGVPGKFPGCEIPDEFEEEHKNKVPVSGTLGWFINLTMERIKKYTYLQKDTPEYACLLIIIKDINNLSGGPPKSLLNITKLIKDLKKWRHSPRLTEDIDDTLLTKEGMNEIDGVRFTVKKCADNIFEITDVDGFKFQYNVKNRKITCV